MSEQLRKTEQPGEAVLLIAKALLGQANEVTAVLTSFTGPGHFADVIVVAARATTAPDEFLTYLSSTSPQALHDAVEELAAAISPYLADEPVLTRWQPVDGVAEVAAFAGARLIATPQFEAAAGCENQLRAAIVAKTPLFRAEPVIRGFVLHVSPAEATRFLILEGWTSAADQETYLARPEMQTYFGEVAPLFDSNGNNIGRWDRL